MEKRSRGAPPKPPDQRKDSLLGIRLTAAERAAVDAVSGGNASKWARTVILEAASKGKKRRAGR
jgi:hypothetical protein